MLSVVNRRRCLQLVAVAWGLLLLASYLWRPLFPVDETRYVSVAWEMWLNGNYLVPHLNGVFYPDKPPLLFWLINLGWSVFGVSEGWARLVPALFALGSFWLLGRLAERFWPMEARSACLAPLFFLGAIFIALYSTAVMFDMLVVFFALAAVLGLWRAASGRPVSGWLGFGLMVGFGILAKGPVILVYVMPGVLLAPWWAPARPDGGWREWYAGALIGVLLSFAVVAVWLVSASVFASDNYLHAILIDQTADRVSGDIGHGRPVWWYVQWLPLVILPWTLWPPLWRGFTQMRGRDGKRDPGTRLLVLSLAMIFVVLSAVGG
ncbi:MAG: glycosyltransferase family 39 protein, partial [Gammaproteobacteria bacterium]